MKPRQHSRAFATVMALVSIGIVGTTIAALMTRASIQSQRNLRELHRAQEEQIQIARTIAGDGQSITLPDEIRTQQSQRF